MKILPTKMYKALVSVNVSPELSEEVANAITEDWLDMKDQNNQLAMEIAIMKEELKRELASYSSKLEIKFRTLYIILTISMGCLLFLVRDDIRQLLGV